TPVAVRAQPARTWSAFDRPEPELTVPGTSGPELPGPDPTVPGLVAEPAPARRPRSVIGTLPPAASYPRRLPLGAPTLPEAANPDAGADETAPDTTPIPAVEVGRPRGGRLP
ncbi:MAG: hypothetical protein M3Y33_19560, partial [Actinomycetota bacterium]|nr:hypothetical protein [Actinomycetota bacterium]